MRAFENARVYLEGRGIQRSNVVFGERIAGFGELGGAEKIELPENAVVLPGFLDEHIHGAGGADTMDATPEALATIAKTVAREGTTGFLATTMTQTPENITQALEAVKRYREHPAAGARLLGVHLEGPFIAEKYKGAQPSDCIAAPSEQTYLSYAAASGNCIKIVTFAPEAAGSEELIKAIRRSGAIASVGHSAASYQDMVRAISLGATHVTHTYNAQSPLHHREIGVVGSALLSEELTCELIADCIHVSVPAMRLLVKCKTPRRVILITDAIRAKGLGDGLSELGGQAVYVKNGEARLRDGTLAGSVLTMNQAVRNLTEKVGLSLEEAVDCATANPARDLGLFEEVGSIVAGKRADFAVLDERYEVLLTVSGGEIVYRR